MGKSKDIQPTGAAIQTNKRSSQATIVSPEDVNEASLQVWRTLPSKIRQDPSLAPFQLENERVYGRAFIFFIHDSSVKLLECKKKTFLGSRLFEKAELSPEPEPGPSKLIIESKEDDAEMRLLNETEYVLD